MDQLIEDGRVHSPEVERALRAVDRRHFCRPNSASRGCEYMVRGRPCSRSLRGLGWQGHAQVQAASSSRRLLVHEVLLHAVPFHAALGHPLMPHIL